MTHEYERIEVPRNGLRLHLNENTGGCSPRVLAAIGRLGPADLATYPDYGDVHTAVARFFGVDESRLLLTNGLDEGILAAAVAWLRGSARDEAIIIEPAFGMYADAVEAAGGHMVTVLPDDQLGVPLAATVAAVTPRTRLVFFASPVNPSGVVVPPEVIGGIARALPPEAVLFLDEAYADFADSHFLGELSHWPNVLVGRTFAKAYGLAGLRAGAVIGHAGAIARLRRIVPPYSLNAAVAAILPVALEDQQHVAWYRGQVEISRELIYAACRRLGLRYWPSQANFVLVHVGDALTRVTAGLAARRIYVRNRSSQPGCAGCVRITAGVAAHTRACVTALEEILGHRGEA
ncbi:MAG: aminotransferase class I/II-fold pyridoxal phosphate-dependent enzyme [Luteitalea sp.]|nr:aminotransferase class I/II-fold pyridoxal phosphate-dependent enzyme [Luteitalea sp.]